MANERQARSKQGVKNTMEEVGRELGVDEQGSRSSEQAGRLAERVKKEVKKRQSK